MILPASCAGTTPLLGRGCLSGGGVLLAESCAPGQCQHSLDLPAGIDCGGVLDNGQVFLSVSPLVTIPAATAPGHFILTGDIPRIVPLALGWKFVRQGDPIDNTFTSFFGSTYFATSDECHDAFDECDAALPQQATRLLFGANGPFDANAAQSGNFVLYGINRFAHVYGAGNHFYSRTAASLCLQFVSGAAYPLWTGPTNLFVETISPIGVRFVTCNALGHLSNNLTADAGGLLSTGLNANLRLPVCRLTIPSGATRVTLDVTLVLGIALAARALCVELASGLALANTVLSETGRQPNEISTRTRTIIQSVTLTVGAAPHPREAIVYIDVESNTGLFAPRVSPRTTLVATNVQVS